MNTFDITLANNNVDGSLIQTVEGRQIHTAMEIVKDYPTWVKAQIERARLVENIDFVKTHQKVTLSATGQSRTNYHFTLDASKNIAMMSGTDKGHSVRAYFISCEKQLLAPKTVELSRLDILQMAVDSEQGRLLAVNKVMELETTVAYQSVKVGAFDRFATHVQGSLCIRDAAKNLQVQEKHLKNYLFENKWVYNREGTSGNTNPLAFSSKLNSGLLEHKIVSPMTHATTQVRVTTKGLTKLAMAFETA